MLHNTNFEINALKDPKLTLTTTKERYRADIFQ